MSGKKNSLPGLDKSGEQVENSQIQQEQQKYMLNVSSLQVWLLLFRGKPYINLNKH
jgi:hypothetical protein